MDETTCFQDVKNIILENHKVQAACFEFLLQLTQKYEICFGEWRGV